MHSNGKPLEEEEDATLELLNKKCVEARSLVSIFSVPQNQFFQHFFQNFIYS
jgi:hypothetical protein